jgi:hypothetical protein
VRQRKVFCRPERNCNACRTSVMAIDHSRLYASPEDFFEQHGSVVMKLTPAAAIGVCEEAASRNLVVARIEGGIWHNPGFEARLDCIWDGADPPIDRRGAEANNARAAEFIKSQSAAHGAFILTAPPLEGWPHKKKDT